MTNFDQIYKEYFKDVYKYVLSLSKNAVVAEEITQETFFKALKNIDKFDGKCKLYVWLCQIAKNTYFSYSTKQKKTLSTTDKTQEYSDAIDIENLLVVKERAIEIHKILHELEEPYKEVFTLRVFGELSFLQIGNLFMKTESWARVTYHRAKKKIKERL
ncbi:sigma-70 family RNA polymerase sigma factor [Vallitaleaceae bacterium 9-2]